MAVRSRTISNTERSSELSLLHHGGEQAVAAALAQTNEGGGPRGKNRALGRWQRLVEFH